MFIATKTLAKVRGQLNERRGRVETIRAEQKAREDLRRKGAGVGGGAAAAAAAVDLPEGATPSARALAVAQAEAKASNPRVACLLLPPPG